MSVFEAVEAGELKPLPRNRFVLATWSTGTIGPDIHVRVGKSLYSVPWRHMGRRVDARETPTVVQIFDAGELIATHGRRPAGKSTDLSHYPPVLWNLICQVDARLPWLTSTIGSSVAVAGTPISCGVGPAGVGTLASRSRSWSRADWPSSTAARSSSVSGIVASMRCRLSLASNNCPVDEAFGA